MSTPRHADLMATPLHTDLIETYLRILPREHGERTVATYAAAIRRAHAQLPAGLPLSDDREIADWIWRDRYSWSTRVVYQAALRGFFRWAVAVGELDYDPTTALPPVRRQRRLPRPCAHDEVQRLLAGAGYPVRTYALLAAYAGARCIEIARLDRRDVTEAAIRLQGKGDRERIVPTHPAVWAELGEYPPGLVAEGAGANRVSQRTSHRCDQLGMPRLTLHQLRHWHATYVLEATGDLRTVQELLGHASPATTAGYTAVAPTTMRRAVEALPTW